MPAGHDEDPLMFPGAERLARFQLAYGDACLAGDPAEAERVVAEAIEAGYDAVTIDDRIIAPVMRLVGDLWAEGRLGVDQEHLATEISMRVLALQRDAFRVAHRRVRHRVLLAAAEGESHVLGLSMAGDVLLQAGYDVRLLGADVPIGALAAAVRRHDPSVVGLTVTMPASAARLPAVLDTIRSVRDDVAFVVGGAAVRERLRPAPRLALCTHVSDIVGLVDSLVQRPESN
jgi:methanogenic corrinoid protein MtbC1